MFQEIAAEQLKLNMNGMFVLLIWAIGNIIVGLLLAAKHKKHSEKWGFYIANAAWNSVNLVLALGSLYMLSSINPEHEQLKEIIYTFFNFEKILVLNLGLDIAYIAIGSFLVERGKHTHKQSFVGYGQALWLQGGFLFLLDMILYMINTFYSQRYAVYILF